MIISAVSRSGATRFCLDQAAELNLRFVGQIDQAAIAGLHGLDKITHHETHRQELLSFDEINALTADHSGCVILNNCCNPSLFKESSFFLTRQNIQNTFFSLLDLLSRQFPKTNIAYFRSSLRQHAFQVGLLHSYLAKNNITPLYYEDIYSIQTEYASEQDPIAREMVAEFVDCLTSYGIQVAF